MWLRTPEGYRTESSHLLNEDAADARAFLRASGTIVIVKHRLLTALSLVSLVLCSLALILLLRDIKVPSERDLASRSTDQLQIGLEREVHPHSSGTGEGGYRWLVVGYYHPFPSPVIGPPNPMRFWVEDGRKMSGGGNSPAAAAFWNEWMRRGWCLDLIAVSSNRLYVRGGISGYPPQDGHGIIYGCYDSLVIPLWTIMFSALIPVSQGMAAIRQRIKVRRTNQLGRCPMCGYDLRATPERCPECGMVPTNV
jgi:hypothetical protein